MGDESVFNDFALTLVYEPVFNQLETRNLAQVYTAKEGFSTVEHQCPGFSHVFLMSLLKKVGLDKEVDIAETYLRLAADSATQPVVRQPQFQELVKKATELKTTLRRIPDEVGDRKKFLETIKEIASAIKNLLDCVSAVSGKLPAGSQKTNLENQKREFVRYSKRFSSTLKAYFKDEKAVAVYVSATFLVNQTNMILTLLQ